MPPYGTNIDVFLKTQTALKPKSCLPDGKTYPIAAVGANQPHNGGRRTEVSEKSRGTTYNTPLPKNLKALGTCGSQGTGQRAKGAAFSQQSPLEKKYYSNSTLSTNYEKTNGAGNFLQ